MFRRSRPELRRLLHLGVSWLQAHQDRNEARMLTPAERREKKLTKLVGEQGPDTLVALYKVRLMLLPLLCGLTCRQHLQTPVADQLLSSEQC